MNCIFLLLLLGCCGFGADGRSGGCGCGNSGISPASNGCGCGTAPTTGSGNIRGGFPSLGSGCGCQDEKTYPDGCCGEENQGARSVYDGNPVNWQEYPEISRARSCDCDN